MTAPITCYLPKIACNTIRPDNDAAPSPDVQTRAARIHRRFV